MWNLNKLVSKLTVDRPTQGIILKTDGRVATWNPAMEELEGFKANEIVGKKFNKFFSSFDTSAQALERMLLKTIKKGKLTFWGLHFTKDGKVIRGSVLIKTIRDGAKNVTGFELLARERSISLANALARMVAKKVVKAGSAIGQGLKSLKSRLPFIIKKA